MTEEELKINISKITDLILKYGHDSDEVKEFCQKHKDEEEFLQIAAVLAFLAENYDEIDTEE